MGQHFINKKENDDDDDLFSSSSSDNNGCDGLNNELSQLDAILLRMHNLRRSSLQEVSHINDNDQDEGGGFQSCKVKIKKPKRRKSISGLKVDSAINTTTITIEEGETR